MGTTVSSRRSEERIYDEIRGAWVVATPEEKVRQALLQKMLYTLAYPKGLISVEVSLSRLSRVSQMDKKIPPRRLDIVCFAKAGDRLRPLLVIECKESETLADKAWQQVLGYNHFIGAKFLAVAHPKGELFGYPASLGFSSLPYLPAYSDLVKAAQYG